MLGETPCRSRCAMENISIIMYKRLGRVHGREREGYTFQLAMRIGHGS